MATNSAINILLAHDHWATAQLLAAARGLSDEQLDRPFEMGMGTLRKTLLHIVETQRTWMDAISGKETDARQDRPSIDELMSRHEAAASGLSAAARVGDLEGKCAASRKGKRYTFPRAGVIAHVLTHGMHHRAQALNMMRHLRVEPLPQSSVLQWMFATGAAKES